MFRPLVLAAATLLVSSISYSQTVITEIETGAQYTALKGVGLSGDSIWLAYTPRTFSAYGSQQSLWISPEGKQHPISFDSVDFNAIVAVATNSYKEWYYFIERSENKQVLRAATRRKDDGTWREETQEVELPGVLLGNHYHNGVLHLICMDPRQTDIKTVAVTDLTVKEEKTYTLHEPLLKKKRNSVAIIVPQHPLAPEEAIAQIKLYWTPKFLTIIKDEPYDEFDQTQTLYKTNVYRINLETNSVEHKFFREETRSGFFSIYFQDHLYRVVGSRSQMRIEIFDIKTGRRRNSVFFAPIISDKQNFAYYADGNAYKVAKAKITKATSPMNYLVADSVSDGIVLRMGSRYGIAPPIPFLYSFGLTSMLISGAANLAILHMPVPATEDYYFYLHGSPEKGFVFSKTATSISQRVTEYDLEMTTKGERYREKVHLYGPNFTYGLYYPKKSTRIQIMKFMDEEPSE